MSLQQPLLSRDLVFPSLPYDLSCRLWSYGPNNGLPRGRRKVPVGGRRSYKKVRKCYPTKPRRKSSIDRSQRSRRHNCCLQLSQSTLNFLLFYHYHSEPLRLVRQLSCLLALFERSVLVPSKLTKPQLLSCQDPLLSEVLMHRTFDALLVDLTFRLIRILTTKHHAAAIHGLESRSSTLSAMPRPSN